MKYTPIFPFVALATFLTRLVVTGANIGDALTIASLCALCGWHSYIKFKEHKHVEALQKDLDTLKTAVSSLKVGNLYGRKTG